MAKHGQTEKRTVSGYVEAGKLLARLRVQGGFEKQKDLADANGIAQQTVSRWEAGVSRPRTGELEKLVALLRPEDPHELYRLCGYVAPEAPTKAKRRKGGAAADSLSLSDTRLLMMWQRHGYVRGSPGGGAQGWELNERGETVVSCWRPERYLRLCLQLEKQIEASLGTGARPEVAVLTRDFGIRVPTLVWLEPYRWEGVDDSVPLSFAPDLCVEIITDALIPELLKRRVAAFLQTGVREVAIVTVTERVVYWTAAGPSETSSLGLALNLLTT